MPAPSSPSEPHVLQQLRRLLLAILMVALVGTAADLFLLEHYEGALQWTPLIMIALGLVVVAWVAAKGSAMAVGALRVLMVLFMATGALGMMMHYQGNWEFQHELDPTAGGWDLFMKIVRAKAPPALAPGVMIQMGLMGLPYTYRHPSLERISPSTLE
jgi:hypothetical protein